MTTIEDVANERVLHLTTTGRRTGAPREIEIWFVVHRGRLYLFAEMANAQRGSRTSGLILRC